jgi:twinkle protein
MRSDKIVVAFDVSAQLEQVKNMRKQEESTVGRAYLSSLMINENDFEGYMKERDTSEHSNIKPANEFHDELITFFNSDSVYSGSTLPWAKTHEQIRLRPGEVTLWSGFNGSGKSLILGQIMLHSLKEYKVCIASLEMRPVTTLARMCRQALGANNPTQDYVKRFCERCCEKLWFYDQLGTVNSERMISVIHYAVEKLGVNHFVIDSLMKCGIADDDYNGQKRFIDKLCAAAKDSRCHIHLVAHSRKGLDEFTPPGKMDVKGSGSITDQVDNVITVWRNKKKEQFIASKNASKTFIEPDTLIICDKQRNGEWEGKIGLWYDKSSTSFTEGNVTTYLDN